MSKIVYKFRKVQQKNGKYVNKFKPTKNLCFIVMIEKIFEKYQNSTHFKLQNKLKKRISSENNCEKIRSQISKIIYRFRKSAAKDSRKVENNEKVLLY